MRVFRSVSLAIAIVIVAFVGVSVEGSLMSARESLQAAAAALSNTSFHAFTSPSWTR